MGSFAGGLEEFIDLVFRVNGRYLASCHGYELFSALSRLVPQLHQEGNQTSVLTIGGATDGTGLILLDRSSVLRLRMPVADIPIYYGLAGKTLLVGEHKISLGVPEIHQIVPAARLKARIVVFPNALEEEAFLEIAQSRLQRREILGTVRVERGRDGKPLRKIMFLKSQRIVGFTTVVENLSAANSIYLQTLGMGKRRHMGCGFFLPYV